MSESSSSSKMIVLGVTGSIAAYKSAEIISLLRKAGHEVFVVMTPSAVEFITPLTLATLSRHPVLCNLSEEKGDAWKPGHIELADRADLFLIAPATANAISRLACGLADDAIGAIALATRAPIMMAPAMNGKMWEHDVIQENVERLRRRRVEFVGPGEGMLACGYEGAGRLSEPEEIVNHALRLIS